MASAPSIAAPIFHNTNDEIYQDARVSRAHPRQVLWWWPILLAAGALLLTYYLSSAWRFHVPSESTAPDSQQHIPALENCASGWTYESDTSVVVRIFGQDPRSTLWAAERLWALTCAKRRQIACQDEDVARINKDLQDGTEKFYQTDGARTPMEVAVKLPDSCSTSVNQAITLDLGTTRSDLAVKATASPDTDSSALGIPASQGQDPVSKTSKSHAGADAAKVKHAKGAKDGSAVPQG
jgi:hypothetical protein